MTKKEHFKLLYDKLDIHHKGIKINRILCAQLMFLAGGNKNAFGGLRNLLLFLCSFDVTELTTISLTKTLAVFGYYPSRKDHRQLMEDIVKRLDEDISYVDTSCWSMYKPHISLKNIVKSLKKAFFLSNDTNLKIKERLLIAATVCLYLNTIDTLSKINFERISKFICLANSLTLENLLTQFFKNKGVKTYSLMEGIYFLQNNELPITNICFENLTSDIQLCWGQYTKDEFIKYGYSPERMIVAGYPKEVEGQLMKKQNSFSNAVVLLSQYMMEEQNQALIKILANYSKKIEFSLKLHPTLDFEEYSRIAEKNSMKIVPTNITINECVNNERFDFAVAINSTTYYEALMRGLPTLRYYDGSYTPMVGCNDEFDSIESFENQLNRIEHTPIEEYQKEVDKALEYAVGWGINEYRNIIEND